MRLSTILILSLFILSTLCLQERINFLNKPVENPQHEMVYGQKEYFFDQVVDHYNYQDTTLWKQRYFAIEDYFNPAKGPVFLYICGQYTCPGVPAARQWVVQLAQKFEGLILVVQHRFYGKSLPFANNSFRLQNMRFLSSQQALSDLAYFIMKTKESNMHKVDKNPWITVGGSYPGAMSAWFRYKYPHLTIGAIASSAVIKAIQNFPQFDQQIYTSSMKSGDFCTQALKKSNDYIESILNSGSAQQFKASFAGGQRLKNDEFMFFWADSIVLIIQYGGRTQLCEDLKVLSEKDQFEYLIKRARKDSEVYQYGSYYLSNQTFQAQKGSGSRSWYYQSCTEFGFWQTPSKYAMRSSLLNIDFYKRFCKDSYGVALWPKVNQKNTEYGAFEMESTNLLMANGDQDPWRWASLQQSKGNIISRVAKCDNCAHCVDLYTPKTNDSDELKKIRNQQFLKLQSWINNFWTDQQYQQLQRIYQLRSQ